VLLVPDFECQNGKWAYIPLHRLPGSLYVLNDKGQCTTIPQLETSEACHTLGVHLAPDGNTLTELCYLILVTKDWQCKMAWSKLSQHKATFSLRQVIFRKLQHPLLATTFSPDQCKLILAPILACGLPSAGIVCTYLHPLVHRPIKYTGLDVPNLHTEQTILHIKQILCIPDPTDVMAFLLCTCCESMHLKVGLASKLFDAPLTLQDVVTPSWIKQIWLTLQSLDIGLHLGILLPMPARVVLR